MELPCYICRRPITVARHPDRGYVFAHGSCLGEPVQIVEYRPGVEYLPPT